MNLFILMLCCFVTAVVSSPALKITKCDATDAACLLESVSDAFPTVLTKNEEIGAQELDPMFQSIIEGNLSILKYKFLNTTVIGFKSCKPTEVKLDMKAMKLQFVLACPAFDLSGQYDIDGQLIVLPVKGNGDFKLTTKKYKLVIDVDLKMGPGKDGKNYLTAKSFTVNAEALEPVFFDFKNLFNGQKDLADAVLKFANENWKEVTDEVQGPVFTANVKLIIQNFNKYFKTIPVEEYLTL